MVLALEDKPVFDRLRAEQPTGGDILTTGDGMPVRIIVRSKLDGVAVRKIVFCRAKIDTTLEKWVLHDGSVGIVCMVLPDSQAKLKRDETGSLIVTSLKVLRYTDNKKSVLCEVIE